MNLWWLFHWKNRLLSQHILHMYSSIGNLLIGKAIGRFRTFTEWVAPSSKCWHNQSINFDLFSQRICALEFLMKFWVINSEIFSISRRTKWLSKSACSTKYWKSNSSDVFMETNWIFIKKNFFPIEIICMNRFILPFLVSMTMQRYLKLEQKESASHSHWINIVNL